MNVLSLFDGISCGQIAFERIGIKFDGENNKYFASEIKKQAIKCALENYPNTIQIGDVKKVTYKDGILYTENGEYKVEIDAIIGGSPCQDFSIAKTLTSNDENKYGLNGDRSSLFYEYLRILKEVKPQYFLLENVKMKKDSEKQLNEYMGVEGLHINSSLVSYQSRPRIYWTNIPSVSIPENKHISFQDYKEKNNASLMKYKLNKTKSRIRMWADGKGDNNISGCKNITYSDKIGCITRKQDRCPNSGLIEFEDFCRYLSQSELEGGQTLPNGYTKCLSYNQAQDVIGDGWTVDVIVHILKGIKQ